MKSGFQYRGYQISKQGDRFLATDLDDQECILESRYVIRLMNGVDALWSALETGEMHTWFTNWMGSPTPTIDLDEPDAAEHLSYDRTPTTPEFTPVIRAAAFALEAAPSEVDPPNKISFLFCCSTVAAVIPVALLIEYFNIDPVIVFRMVVVFAAVVFGVVPAIVVTALSMFAYNFSAVPPVFDLTIPTSIELYYGLTNLVMSFVAPWLHQNADKFKRTIVRTLSGVSITGSSLA